MSDKDRAVNTAYVIGLDLGTTAIKAALYDIAGHCVAESQQEVKLITPQPGWVEQDPSIWYEHLCDLIKTITADKKKENIIGIGISSQGISFVPVDASLNPLHNVFSWLDGRAAAETDWIKSVFKEDELFRITGKHVSAFYSLPKILWLRKNRPGIFKQTHKILCAMDYAITRFTGRAVTEPTMAAGTMMYDISQNCWSGEIFRKCGIDKSLMPEITGVGMEAGVLSREAAELSGLMKGIPVFCAGQDQKTAACGAGITDGVVTVSLGTAAAFEVLTDCGINTENSELPVCPCFDRKKRVLEGCVNTAGAAIKWLNNTVVRANDYAEMDRLCAASPPGSRGVLFYPLLEENGSCGGITLGTGIEDIVRALFEGIIFEIKIQLDAALRTGADIRRLNVFGGAARSEILCKILADVSGYPVQTFKNRELCLLGAAKISAAALGADTETFIKNSLAQGSLYEPNREIGKLYSDVYSRYMSERRK